MTSAFPVSAETRLVGIDWGTSSLRLVAMNGQGETVASLQSDRGITRIGPDGFDAAIEQALSPWQLPVSVPLILSGMIGSRNGWVETPYLDAPVPLASLAGALVSHRSRAARHLYFVPGIRLVGRHADVMRGEETELLGWFEKNPQHQISQSFVLPGTHCKWVHTEHRQITGFRTCMTGEVFAVLCEHSILGRLMAAGPADDLPDAADAAFELGARRGLAEPENLLANLFSARALPLLERMHAAEIRPYLAGLLIGSEVAGQHRRHDEPLVVIGRGELAERYVRVLHLAGAQADCAEPGSAIAGQFAIARMAGLVS